MLTAAVSEWVRKRQWSFPRDSIRARASTARYLNNLNGCTVFHAWNIGQIPADDLEDIDLMIRWEKTIREDMEDK